VFPELFSAGSFTVHTYGLLVALGVLASIILAEYMHRRTGGEPGRIIDMSFMVVLAGLLGARLIYVLVNFQYYTEKPLETLMLWKGGLVFYGGLIGGAGALIVLVHWYRLSIREMMDIGAAAVCIGHAFGRLGCFAAGCCYGRFTDLPWAVTFTNPDCLAVEVINEPVHPVQLYSFVFLSCLTVFLVWLHRRRSFPGQVAVTYIIFYCLFRFGVEFLRGDPRGTLEILGATLSVSQWLSLVVFLLGVGMYTILRRKESESRIHEPGDRRDD
jgi:phosphatidylglycerol:prolipoprotein diacylglycerol transferase